MSIDLGGRLAALQSEVELVSATIREKGRERFMRTAVLAAAMVLGAYYLLYLPPNKKRAQLERQIAAAQLAAQNAEAYKVLHAEVQAALAKLPRRADREKFLTQAILETLKAENITSDSIQPPTDRISAEIIYQTIAVSAEIKISEIAAWLARLEAAKPYLQLTNLEIAKGRIGYCKLRAEVGTMIPQSEPLP